MPVLRFRIREHEPLSWSIINSPCLCKVDRAWVTMIAYKVRLPHVSKAWRIEATFEGQFHSLGNQYRNRILNAQGKIQALEPEMRRPSVWRFVAQAKSPPSHITQSQLTRHQVHYDIAPNVEPRLIKRCPLTSTQKQRARPVKDQCRREQHIRTSFVSRQRTMPTMSWPREAKASCQGQEPRQGVKELSGRTEW